MTTQPQPAKSAAKPKLMRSAQSAGVAMTLTNDAIGQAVVYVGVPATLSVTLVNRTGGDLTLQSGMLLPDHNPQQVRVHAVRQCRVLRAPGLEHLIKVHRTLPPRAWRPTRP